MRSDDLDFAALNLSLSKQVRVVVRLVFDVQTVYATSDPDMINVPGVPVLGCLQNVSAVSQEIHPDEGRSTIGTLSFSLVDIDEQITDELRDQLQTNFQNLRGRTIQLRFGYTSDYDDTVLLMTQVVRSIEYSEGVYNITCNDIQRSTRKDIFDPVITNLRLTVSATATTIPVQSTTGFETVYHGPSYTDAPNATVGYIRIDDEVIRYTSKNSQNFLGCTRGVFNTVATVHEIDDGAAVERQPEVEEWIYLELPVAKLLIAVLTGDLEGDNEVLPDHWHLSIDPALVA